MCELRVNLPQAANQVVLQDPSLHAPVKVSTGILPADAISDHPLGLHPSRAVVQIRKGGGHRCVKRHQLLFSRLDLLFDVLLLIALGSSQLGIHGLQFLIDAVHGLHLLGGSVLHLDNAWRLQNTTSCVHIGVHLHLLRVDGWINDHPCSATQFAVLGDVDENWVFVLDKGIHNHGAKFQDLIVHVTGATRKASPIGENDDGQVLSTIEVLQGLCRFKGAVREPNLATHALFHLATLRVGRIRGDQAIHAAGLNSNDTHGNASQTCTASDHRAAPALQVLDPGSSIEETTHAVALVVNDTPQEIARIIWQQAGLKVHITIPWVHPCGLANGRRRRDVLGNKAQPVQDGRHSLLIVPDHLVRHAVGHHDLWPTQLILGGVDVLSQEFV
mmetsp:Transcript_78729/g.160090  ORF Transcript_78729/g.160090 Transcript_78729/m.160090 type:complete len:387 (-) Transcript_78729:840-2000(-)